MTYICIYIFFVLYWFAFFLKFGNLPSQKPRSAPVGCSRGSETKDKIQVNTLHKKNNHKVMVKKLPIKLSTAK